MGFKNVAIIALGALLMVGGSAMAAEKRHAHTHVHGAAEMNIVVEGKKITVDFRSPAEDVMGFEHEAKSDADKKKRDAAMKVIKERFGDMVVFDKKLGCAFQPGDISLVRTDGGDSKDPKHGKDDQKKSGEHREVRATHHFTCDQDPSGSRVRFAVTKTFPGIHDLKVQVLSGAKQSGATIKRDKGDVGL
jgi:hypothetical protein